MKSRCGPGWRSWSSWRSHSGFCCSSSQTHECGMNVIGSGVGYDAYDRAMRKHSPLMQHHEIVIGPDFVEQMRRPQHADPLLRHQLPHVVEDVGAGLDVEPDGRF